MKEINKRDIILIILIILITVIIAGVIIIPKSSNKNEINNLNNNRDVVANSPASPEELFSRPIDPELPEIDTNEINTFNMEN